MLRRSARAVAVLVLVTAVAGCSGGSGSAFVPSTSGSASSGGSGGSVVDKGVVPDTGSPSPSVPSSAAPTTAPPVASSTRTGTPPPGLRDFREVTFSVPSGFQISSSYEPLTPLESDFTTHYLVPASAPDTKEVISLYVYTLPAARTVTSRSNQPALIKAYNAKAKAVVSGNGIRRAETTIDGLPAYTETATESGDYTYIAYWVFGTHHFLLYSCQLGSSGGVAGLAVACGTTLASLQLN